jgi:plasmid maintenance system antidote protein VapI
MYCTGIGPDHTVSASICNGASALRGTRGQRTSRSWTITNGARYDEEPGRTDSSGRNPGRRTGSHRHDGYCPGGRIGVPKNRLYKIINAQRRMASDTAMRLGVFFGTGLNLWMNLQKTYELAVAQQKIGDNLKARKPYDRNAATAALSFWCSKREGLRNIPSAL